MNYKEIEFKYKADNVKLEDFKIFCEERGPLKRVEASGYDHFYESTKVPGAFCRHRIGPDMNQLTFKRKTVDKNNYVRTEHNLNLESATVEQIKALVAEFGYMFNTSLFKSCFVYTYGVSTLVYYICYNTNLEETGRFIEIEMSEDYKFDSEEQAYAMLVDIEYSCKALGLSPQGRIKRSLFEMYRKDL